MTIRDLPRIPAVPLVSIALFLVRVIKRRIDSPIPGISLSTTAFVASGTQSSSDACPVVAIIEKIAKENSIPVTLLCDTNHVLSSAYSEVIVVGAGADAVDYKLISICHKGDIVVSQDYGVAAMALGKGAYAIHQSGKWYTNDNIDQMLMERHLNKKARRSSHKNHIKGPKKRTEEDDVRFAQSFEKMLMMVQEKFQKNTKTMEAGRKENK